MKDYSQDLIEIAQKFSLDIPIFASLVHQESSGDPTAERFEPGFYESKIQWRSAFELSGHVPDKCKKSDAWLTFEHIQRSTSYGLCQLMGETCRWALHVQDTYLDRVLFQPRLNLTYGATYLKRLMGAYSKLPKDKQYWFALRQYNGAGEYADKIFAHVKDETYAYLLPDNFIPD